MPDQERTALGTIGDVNPLQYDGGFVFQDSDGRVTLEYAMAPPDDHPWFRRNGYKAYDLPLRTAPYTVYRVDVSEDVKKDLSWLKSKDWAAIAAHGNGEDTKTEGENLACFLSKRAEPLQRAMIYWDVANHFGWNNLDDYPLWLTGEELAERWGLDESWGDKTCEVGLWRDTAQAMKEMCKLLSVLEHGDDTACLAALPGIRNWLKENHAKTSQFQADLNAAMTVENWDEDKDTEEEDDE